MRTLPILLASALALSCASTVKKPDKPAAPAEVSAAPKSAQPASPDPGSEKPLKLHYRWAARPGWKAYPPNKDPNGGQGPRLILTNLDERAQIPVYLHLTDLPVDQVAKYVRADVEKQGSKMAPELLDGSGRQDGVVMAFVGKPDGVAVSGRIAVFQACPDPRLVIVMIGFWPVENDAKMASDFAKLSGSFQLIVD